MACMDEGFAGLVGELVAMQTRMRESMECLLGPCDGVEYDGGLWEDQEEEAEEPARSVSGVVSFSDTEDYGDGDHASSDDEQSFIVVPGPVDEVVLPVSADADLQDNDGTCSEPAPSTQPLPIGTKVSALREPVLDEETVATVDKDGGETVDNDQGANNEDVEESEANLIPTAGSPSGSTSSIVVSSSAAPTKEISIVIDMKSVLSFTLTCLERSAQLFKREVVKADQLAKLFSYLQRLIPRVDDYERPQRCLPQLLQTIDLATTMALRSKFERADRIRLVDPVRIALLGCRCDELAGLAARLGTSVLDSIFPSGFVAKDMSALSIEKTWNVLMYLERCDRNRVHEPGVVQSWLKYLEKNLSPTAIQRQRETTSTKVAPLPLLFVDLFIAVHLTLKLAPLEETFDFVNWLGKIKEKYQGDDNLIEMYQTRVFVASKCRTVGRDPLYEKQFNYDVELKLIKEKLEWYFRLHGHN